MILPIIDKGGRGRVQAALTLPIARKRSFTFIAVFAEVSINNKLLSSA
jgi:hypothetical protein